MLLGQIFQKGCVWNRDDGENLIVISYELDKSGSVCPKTGGDTNEGFPAQKPVFFRENKLDLLRRNNFSTKFNNRSF